METVTLAGEPILFVIDRFANPHAGTEGQLFRLVEGLPRERFEPRLLVLTSSPYIESGEFPCPVDVLGGSSLVRPSVWWKLLLYALGARKRGVRVAHVFFNDASVLCPPVFGLTGIRTIISRRDMGYWYTPGYLRVLRITGKCVDRVVVNSQAVGAVTMQQERIPSRKLALIYNGFAPKPQEVVEMPHALAELRSRTATPLAVIVANLRKIKRIEDAITAAGHLRDMGVRLDLVIIGGGDQSALQSHVAQLDLADRIHFLGARQDIATCLRFCDLGILCSESEGYSNAIVEYMMAALPVIATDVGGNKEAVIEGKTGYRYAVGNIPQLVEKLGILVENPEHRVKMGAAGQALAGARHDLTGMIEAHEALYYSLLPERKSARQNKEAEV